MKTIRIPLAALAAALLTVPAISAPLDTKGIPADAIGVIYVDADAMNKSKFGKELEKIKKEAPKKEEQEALEKFQKQIGFDPEKDLRSVTIGLLKSAEPMSPPTAVAVMRGSFSPDKIVAAAKENNLPVTTQDKLTVIDLGTLGDALNFGGEKIAAVAAIVDANTILLAPDAKFIDKAAAALTGASFAPPAALEAFLKQEGTLMILGSIGGNIVEMPAGAAVGMPEAMQLAFSEKGANLRLRLSLDFANPKAAAEALQSTQGMIGMLPMIMSQDQSPEGAAKAKAAKSFTDRIKFNQKDKNLDVLLEYPSADLLDLIKAEMLKAKDKDQE